MIVKMLKIAKRYALNLFNGIDGKKFFQKSKTFLKTIRDRYE